MTQNQAQNLLHNLLELIPVRQKSIECTGMEDSASAYALVHIYHQHRLPMAVLVATPQDAEKVIENMQFFAPSTSLPINYVAPYNVLPYKFMAYHNETAAKRIRALYHLIDYEQPPITILTAGALLKRLIPKNELLNYAELLIAGEETDREQLIEKLIAGGYNRTIVTEEAGDFSVRGGIVDIFTPLYDDPLRIEFFGDIVDSIRFFSATDQRSHKKITEAVILPASEAILKMSAIDEILGRVRKQALDQNMPVSNIRTIIDRIRKERQFSGIESLLPLIYPQLDSIFDYLPQNTLLMTLGQEEVEKAVAEFQAKIQANFDTANKADRLCLSPSHLYMKWDTALEKIKDRKPLIFKTLPTIDAQQYSHDCDNHRLNFSIDTNSSLSSDIKTHRARENLLQPLFNWVRGQIDAGLRVLVVGRNAAQVDRLRGLLGPYGIEPQLVDEMSDLTNRSESFFICIGQLTNGFVWPQEQLALVTDEEIFGIPHKKRKTTRKPPHSQLLTLGELRKGDLVVHVDYGIGQYSGLHKLELNRSIHDFLLIVYRDGDKLFLPADRMMMIHKYMGVDGIMPVIDKMGGKSWSRVKERVKRSAEKIAGELLKVYALRKVAPGYTYAPNDNYFRDFEARFPFEETSDQMAAIEDVVSDMEAPTPMDRLICGDVGYGKTEVALRAAFKAVNDNKQVALLVPTTVLAEQHYQTFTERFEDYPVNLACLSRFRSTKMQREIVNNLKTGSIDIVIGTHRLLQQDIGFKDIGLVIIDEEQRFGVKHKERLKKLRNTVDVLALTATPIPRTLHMSMMGVRDISIISTPPEHRHSIITYISEFDDAVIAEAIRKEMGRKGQIFFVHNHVQSILRTANHLQALVPEVRLDVAHGQMHEKELEQVMVRFLNREIDLLVCTTIIESGLDIPAANTILINRADRFGLAQIYQLRGRVGRADQQAYAYLFIPKESTLTRDAQKRLKVLMEHSDLGSGFQIAMSDLRIRGGGTILGASQSGHIAAVGYEMFLDLMSHAMAEIKGEEFQKPLEPEINIAISDFIPETFIPDIDQRLFTYRQLAKVASVHELTELRAELTDRYGVLPEEVNNLLLKIGLKILAVETGVAKLDLVGHKLHMRFSEAHLKNPGELIEYVQSCPLRSEFNSDQTLKIRLPKQSINGLMAETKNILKEISQHVNG